MSETLSDIAAGLSFATGLSLFQDRGSFARREQVLCATGEHELRFFSYKSEQIQARQDCAIDPDKPDVLSVCQPGLIDIFEQLWRR